MNNQSRSRTGGGQAAWAGIRPLDRLLKIISPQRDEAVELPVLPPTQQPVPPPDSTLGMLSVNRLTVNRSWKARPSLKLPVRLNDTVPAYNGACAQVLVHNYSTATKANVCGDCQQSAQWAHMSCWPGISRSLEIALPSRLAAPPLSLL